MGYFDSAKNRVLWQRELNQLKVERNRRASVGYDRFEAESEAEKETPGRQRITFAQLEREELKSSGKEKASRSRSRNKELERNTELHRQQERTLG